MPVRSERPARGAAHRAARAHRPGLARLPARGAPRPAVRLPRARPVPARRKATASTRTSCCSTRMRATSSASCAGATRCSATRVGHRDGDLSFDRRDSARRHAASARCIDTAFTWGDDRRPDIPWHEMVIYELHVRGFTMRHPDVPRALRGTYAGLASAAGHRPPAAPRRDHGRADAGARLRRRPPAGRARACATTGATTPSASSRPRRATASTGNVGEFKTMVKTLHSAGIEVILDVVYNHTAEGNELGPTLCLPRHRQRRPTTGSCPATPRYYQDFTGCGNTLNMQHPRVLQLMMDSLRYWVDEMHVDGFRFDLASALARELHDVDRLGVVLRHPAPGPGAVAGQADRRAVGPRRAAATRSATSRPAGPSGTTSTATRCARTGRATAA